MSRHPTLCQSMSRHPTRSDGGTRAPLASAPVASARIAAGAGLRAHGLMRQLILGLMRRLMRRLMPGLGLLILMLASPALAAERQVAGPQDLAQAIAEAAPGDVLRLAPGAYGALRISRRFEGKPLTIRAQDPENRPEFTGIFLREAQGLVLEDLAVLWRATGPEDTERYRASSVEKSQDVTLRRILFEGDVARAGRPEVRGSATAFGLWLRFARSVTVEDCEFRIWHRALIVSDSQDITLRGSQFHSLRSDGVDFVAVQGLLVEKNWFHDFSQMPGSGDHADMIQFWTNRSKTPSTDITIRDNLFNSGHGLFTHSIFMRNEEVDTGRAGPEMFYRNIKITGNIIINAHLHGISIGEADGVLIDSNTLVRNRLSAGPGGTPALWTPSIRVSEKSQNVRILRNITPKITGPELRPDWQVAGNLLIQDKSPARPDHYDKVFAAAIMGDPSSLASFAYLPGGPADEKITGKAVGAPGLRPDRIAARTGEQAGGQGLAVLRVSRDPALINRFHFDASQTLAPQTLPGQTLPGQPPEDPPARPLPVWDFGDGHSAQGETVTHDFARPGQYQVVLQTGPGRNDRTQARIDIPEPQLLHFDPQIGLIAGSTPVEGAAARGGRLAFGGGAGSVEIPAQAIAGIFTRPDFDLTMDLAATGGGNPSGEILRVHEVFILGMAPTGSLTLSLFEEGQKKPRGLRTPPARLNDGQPHRISLRADRDKVEIHVDGALVLRVKLTGPLRQVTNRPLVLGGAFGKTGMTAELRDLQLTAGARSFAPQ